MDSFTSFLSNVAKTAQDSVIQAASAVKAQAEQHHAKFLAEREAYTKGDEGVQHDVASQLPWEGLGSSPRAQEVAAEVREAVESLVEEGSVFKSDPPAAAGWRFEIESQIVAVERLLDACPDIETARFRLVPRVMKEGRFFSNLFFGIELIRQSALNDLATEEEPALSAAAAATDHGEDDQDTEDLRYADASEEVASKPALPAAAAAVAAERVQAAPGAAAASLSEGDRQPRAGASFRRLGVADAPPPRPQTDLLSDAALAESMAGSAASGLADDGTAPLSATGRAGAAAWDSVAQREGGGSGDDTLDAALEAYIGRATDEALGGQHEQDATPAAEVAAALGDLDDEQISSVSSASPSAGAAVAEDDGEDADVGELELSAAEMEDLLDGEEDAGEVDAELEAAIAAELEADMG